MHSMIPYASSLRRAADSYWGDGFLNAFFRMADMPRDTFRVDIRDEGEHYLLLAEMPGVDPREIDVSVEQGMLTISARTSDASGGPETVYRERHAGQMRRTFSLEHVDEEAVTARSQHGLLVVTLPKRREETHAQARHIPVQ